MRRTIHKKTLVLAMLTQPDVIRGIKIHNKTTVPIQMLKSVIYSHPKMQVLLMHTPLEFSEEQVAIFTRMYEEGYDVFVMFCILGD